MADQRTRNGLRVGADPAGEGRDGRGRSGWAEPVGATLLAEQPRRHDLQSPCAGQPQPERLVDLDAAHPRRVDARLAGRQQPAARVQAAEAVAGEPEAPEGQDVGEDGQHAHEAEDEHHVDPPRQLAQLPGAFDEHLALVGETGEALGEEAERRRRGGESGGRERREADPRRVEPQQHLLVGHRHHVEVRAELADVDGRAGRGGQARDLGGRRGAAARPAVVGPRRRAGSPARGGRAGRRPSRSRPWRARAAGGAAWR